jgi:CHASE3 domain sensor protein
LVKNSQQVRQGLQSTLSTLQDAETGQRGYLLTGKDNYLEPHLSALSQINGNIKNLRQLTSDRKSQQQQISLPQQKTAEKLGVIEQTIALRRTQGINSAQQVVLSGKGKKLMDDIRQIIAQMENAKNELLYSRTQDSKATKNTIATLSIAAILNLALLALLYYFIVRHITERQRAEEALGESEENFRFFTMFVSRANCCSKYQRHG